MVIPFIRPAKPSDLDSLLAFAKEARYGFTSLPPYPAHLKQRIEESTAAFENGKGHYLFVLEENGKPIGCSGIVSHIGEETPFFAYHLLHERQRSEYLGIDRNVSVLHRIRAQKNPTEISSLFLEKESRGKHMGKLLSYSRFLFMATFKSRFAPLVITELRGFCDPQGHSPFWDAIGYPFFGLRFQEATELRYTHPECVHEIFPKHPVYPMLLPKEAQAALRETHSETRPALKLLQKQGFSFSSYVDLFDGGPHLYAEMGKIQAIVRSSATQVKEVRSEAIASERGILTNERLDFRACMGIVEMEEGGLVISSEARAILEVEVGDAIRFLPTNQDLRRR